MCNLISIKFTNIKSMDFSLNQQFITRSTQAGHGGYSRSYIHETGYNMKERKREKEKKKEERGRLTKCQVDMKTKESRELNRD